MSLPAMPAHLPKLPDNLCALPKGSVYLGLGGTFKVAKPFEGWSTHKGGKWYDGENFHGINESAHYAAPADSQIARLNGHVAQAAGEPEAVALVRQLVVALKASDSFTPDYHDAREQTDEAIIEAEAFLAREASK